MTRRGLFAAVLALFGIKTRKPEFWDTDRVGRHLALLLMDLKPFWEYRTTGKHLL
jgi:hypothetical protein